uniref:Tetratricopeptide TPR_2 repeat protein n=1 Tax=Solibacter usitatus (strain Ellin6076) TaxID=234267 RepID=Q01Z72_SOLUE
MVRRGPLIVLAGAAACAAGAGLLWSHYTADIPSLSSPPALAGSGSCQGCHPKFYELWSTSHHGLAMQPVSADFVRRNLNLTQAPVRVGQATYAPEVDAKSAWLVERSPQGTRRYPLEQAMGGKNVYYFLTTLERGHMQVLPLSYDVNQRQWIDAAGNMVMHESGPSTAPADWRDRTLTFNTSCYGCHVSQLATNYDAASDSYRTQWREAGINCETCHGPSAEHVRLMRQAQREKRDRPPDDLKIVSVKNLTKVQRNDLCASCHAKLMAYTPGFKPGDRFFDYYNVAAFESDDFFPDGRDYRENYTFTSWSMSPCARTSDLDCLHCHTSSGRYRFKEDKLANNACMPCHEERVKNVAAHTHHKPDSAGSRCTSCHMPSTGYARMVRSDHSMRPPTPATTLAYKSPNACNACHADRDAGWADKQVRKWYKRDYQAPVLAQASLISSARNRYWTRLPAMLAALQRPGREPVFTASLIRLLGACPDRQIIPLFAVALEDPSPLVRSAAAEALSQNPSPLATVALLRAAKDNFRMVRIQAGVALSRFQTAGVEPSVREAVDRAVGEYVASLEARPDDFRRRLNLGVLRFDRGQYQQSIAEYQAAIRLRPDAAQPLVNESLAYNRLGENDRAEEALHQALRLDPRNSSAYLNLGLLMAEKRRIPDAEAALRGALDTDPDNAAAAFNLAVIVSGSRANEAIDLCRRAVKAAPGEPKYVYTLAFYLAQSGDTPGAAAALRRAISAGVANTQCYRALMRIYLQQGQPREALALSRQAAADPALPERDRASFLANR